MNAEDRRDKTRHMSALRFVRCLHSILNSMNEMLILRVDLAQSAFFRDKAGKQGPCKSVIHQTFQHIMCEMYEEILQPVKTRLKYQLFQ